MITSPAYTDQFYNIIRGVQYDMTMTVYLNNMLMDLTGYTASFSLKESADSDRILLTLANGNGITLGGAAGTVSLAISETATDALPAGTVYFYLDMTANGVTKRYAEGPIKVRR